MDISCTASTVTLAMKPTHASDAQVAAVRGCSGSSLSPHEEDISPNFESAPRHVLSCNGGGDGGSNGGDGGNGGESGGADGGGGKGGGGKGGRGGDGGESPMPPSSSS